MAPKVSTLIFIFYFLLGTDQRASRVPNSAHNRAWHESDFEDSSDGSIGSNSSLLPLDQEILGSANSSRQEEEGESPTQRDSAPIHSHSLDWDADGEDDDDDDVDAEDESPNVSLVSSKPVLDEEESTVEASDDTITEDANGNHINK